MHFEKNEVIFLNITEPIRDMKKIKQLSEHLKATNERDYMMFRTFLYLGLRTSDTLSLKVKDVRDKYKIHFKESKTRKVKIVEIHPSLQTDFEAYTKDKDDEEYLFKSTMKNKDGTERPISREQAFRRLQKAAVECDLDQSLSGHTLRKTFCYHSYQNGTPLSVLSELLNHSSEAVTRKYIGLEQENIKQAYHAVNFD